MNCKFCNELLPEDVTLCPACGQENNTPAEADTEAVPEAAEMTAEVTAEETAEATGEETAEDTAETAEEEAVTETEGEAAPEEAAPRKKNLWLIILAAIGGVAVALVLIGAVLHGMGIDITGKTPKSYTVSDEKAVKAQNTVVATVGSEELTNSQLQVYYWQSVNDFVNYYGYYMDMSTLGLDLSAPLDTQFYDEEAGITWQQHFLELSLQTWSRYAAMANHARESGFQLPADAQAYLDSLPQQLDEMALTYGYESAEQMLSEDMSAACNPEGYLEFIYINHYVAQYLESVYDQMVPSLEELEAYYQENEETLNATGIVRDGSRALNVRHILITPLDADDDGTSTEEEWQTCRQEAQALLEQWQKDGTEEGFAQLAMEKTQDPGSAGNGGLYTNVVKGQMVEPFENWCFDESRKYGDTGLVETEYGVHIMFFVESWELWQSNLEAQILTERSTALVEQAQAKWPMEVNYKKIVLGDANAA